jgi:hypothetical protein
LAEAGNVLALFTDETVPDGTTFGTVKQMAFTILDEDKLTLVSHYLRKATLDETAYEWQQYAHCPEV